MGLIAGHIIWLMNEIMIWRDPISQMHFISDAYRQIFIEMTKDAYSS